MNIEITSKGRSAVFSALGDESRRAILALLRGGSRRAGELAAGLPITKATLSHHMKVLLAAGLVRCERRGRERIYAINTSVCEDVSGMLLALFRPVARRRGTARARLA